MTTRNHGSADTLYFICLVTTPYYRNHEKKGKPVGEIDLSKVILICTCPEKHQMSDFKCSSASVMFLRVEDFMPKSARGYFLIGENSEEVDGWMAERVIKSCARNQTSTSKQL
ncbi:hypothetical protein IRJ41_011279 [Triplophysa rosa]|uniref:Uncharacterized protein n=1 Tax=Triplophysa rosa TaxID=992332 RepID=A0A9W7TIF4_TRIRA|nr:hypothetical protein IRJ41_011279 [Triplophysa rosa]